MHKNILIYKYNIDSFVRKRVHLKKKNMDLNYDQEYMRKFLLKRKALSIKKIEKMSDIPEGTLRHFITGRRNLPEKHFKNVEKVMLDYGYNLIQ
jgi:hypothetical protein